MPTKQLAKKATGEMRALTTPFLHPRNTAKVRATKTIESVFENKGNFCG